MTTTRELLLAAGIGITSALGSVALVAAVLVRLPADHFTGARLRPAPVRHPLVRLLRTAGRNLLGLVLVAGGIIMAIPGVPGQGLLTIFLGVLLLDFPGKERLERALLRRPTIMNSINRLRAHYGRPPLETPGPRDP